MPIYWSAQVVRQATAWYNSPTGQQVQSQINAEAAAIAAFLAAGWATIAGAAWWFGESDPQLPPDWARNDWGTCDPSSAPDPDPQPLETDG